jgi:arylsulfatase A-like enzyme
MVLHEQTGYQELARLPLVIRFPDAAHAGLRVPHLAAMVDLMPTLLEILDIPIPDQVQGRSVLGSVTGGQSVRDDLHMYSSIRSGYWNFHSDRRELYNLQDDPLEQINLYDRRPAVVEELERRVRSLLREDHRRFEAFKNVTETTAGRVILDEAQIRELRSLGYVVE